VRGGQKNVFRTMSQVSEKYVIKLSGRGDDKGGHSSMRSGKCDFYHLAHALGPVVGHFGLPAGKTNDCDADLLRRIGQDRAADGHQKLDLAKIGNRSAGGAAAHRGRLACWGKQHYARLAVDTQLEKEAMTGCFTPQLAAAKVNWGPGGCAGRDSADYVKKDADGPLMGGQPRFHISVKEED